MSNELPSEFKIENLDIIFHPKRKSRNNNNNNNENNENEKNNCNNNNLNNHYNNNNQFMKKNNNSYSKLINNNNDANIFINTSNNDKILYEISDIDIKCLQDGWKFPNINLLTCDQEELLHFTIIVSIVLF